MRPVVRPAPVGSALMSGTRKIRSLILWRSLNDLYDTHRGKPAIGHDSRKGQRVSVLLYRFHRSVSASRFVFTVYIVGSDDSVTSHPRACRIVKPCSHFRTLVRRLCRQGVCGVPPAQLQHASLAHARNNRATCLSCRFIQTQYSRKKTQHTTHTSICMYNIYRHNRQRINNLKRSAQKYTCSLRRRAKRLAGRDHFRK